MSAKANRLPTIPILRLSSTTSGEAARTWQQSSNNIPDDLIDKREEEHAPSFCGIPLVPMFLFNTFREFNLHDTAAGKPIIWLVAGAMSIVFVVMIGHHHLSNKAGPTPQNEKFKEYLKWLGLNLHKRFNDSGAANFTNECFDKNTTLSPSLRLLQTWQDQGLQGVSIYESRDKRCLSIEMCRDIDISPHATVSGFIPGILEPDYYVLVSTSLGYDNRSQIGLLVEMSHSMQSLINSTDWLPARSILFVAWGNTDYRIWAKDNEIIAETRIVTYLHLKETGATLSSIPLMSLLASTGAVLYPLYYSGNLQEPLPCPNTHEPLNSNQPQYIPHTFLKETGIPWLETSDSQWALEMIRKLVDGVIIPINVMDVVRCLNAQLLRYSVVPSHMISKMEYLTVTAEHFHRITADDFDFNEAMEFRLLNAHQINGRLMAFLKCYKPLRSCPTTDSLIVRDTRGSWDFYSNINIEEVIHCSEIVLSQFA